MKTENVRCPVEPEKIKYTQIADGLAEVWIRKNIQKVTSHSEGDESTYEEYDYTEVYFRTSDSKEDIEADFEGYFLSGAEWEPEVSKTESQRMQELAQEVQNTKNDLAQSQLENDMAIAEITMVMAAMMTPGIDLEGGDENV